MSDTFKPRTKMVHGGTRRSQYNEVSEAIFLTQGFVYDSAEAAEARFKGEDEGFIYSRYANPTVDMFEQRMCTLEGAEDARATASGMAAVSAALLCQLKAGDHVVAARALFGSCRWVIETLMPQFGIEMTLIDGPPVRGASGRHSSVGAGSFGTASRKARAATSTPATPIERSTGAALSAMTGARGTSTTSPTAKPR